MKKISLDTYILLWIILIVSLVFMVIGYFYSNYLYDSAKEIYDNNTALTYTPHEGYMEIKLEGWQKENSDIEKIRCLNIFVDFITWKTIKDIFKYIFVVSVIIIIISILNLKYNSKKENTKTFF